MEASRPISSIPKVCHASVSSPFNYGFPSYDLSSFCQIICKSTPQDHVHRQKLSIIITATANIMMMIIILQFDHMHFSGLMFVEALFHE